MFQKDTAPYRKFLYINRYSLLILSVLCEECRHSPLFPNVERHIASYVPYDNPLVLDTYVRTHSYREECVDLLGVTIMPEVVVLGGGNGGGSGGEACGALPVRKFVGNPSGVPT